MFGALVGSLVLAGCGGGSGLDATALAECGARGHPVTLSKLVRIFRKNGITLEINQPTCAATATERSQAALPDATNLGSSGISPDKGVERMEGTVFCRVYESGTRRRVDIVKYPTDAETRLGVLYIGVRSTRTTHTQRRHRSRRYAARSQRYFSRRRKPSI